MNYSVFDIETDGLIEEATVIHCLSIKQYKDGNVRHYTTTDYEQMRKFFLSEPLLVGHNIIRFDIPVAEKLLGIKIKAKLIDSLGISWYLYPLEIKHGLEEWGEKLGVAKPVISDWKNLQASDYIHRCQTDVVINDKLFSMQVRYLKQIYAERGIDRIMQYITFKLECAREQEEVKWKLDVERCKAGLAKLEAEKKIKIDVLSSFMPLKIEFKKATKPKVMFKKDGSFSMAGERWNDLLKSRRLPMDHEEPIPVETKRVKGNAGSHKQIKDWLFELGWKPDEFKYNKKIENGVEVTKAVPQITTVDDSSVICKSIKDLYVKEPALKHLDSLGVLSHRIGILEGFLETKNENDMLKAEIAGFTNTMRFKHKKPLVNLPTIPKPYWEEIRSCLIAPDENHILCGSDMSGLEDNTKRHYMFYYDPAYVEEMMGEDFDAHLDIAVLANMLTQEEADEHKLYDKTKGKEGKSHKATRGKAKKVNFSGVYGAGPPKIAITANIPLGEAKVLHTTYWERNWSVKQIAKDCIVKTTINGQMWLFNPVSHFWYSLRSNKDRFSTLNQGTGVYCFDTWNSNVRKQGVKVCGQFHDEIIAPLLKGKEEEFSKILKTAIQQTNDKLKLNVQLRISIDYGHSYADIH